MFEKVLKWCRNLEKRNAEWCIRFTVKHWRKADLSVIGVGVSLFVLAVVWHDWVFAVGGSAVTMMGMICYVYDKSLKRTGCMEKVVRDMQKV